MGWMTQEVHDKIKFAAQELGVELDYSSEIQKGDLYLAARNGPAQLLTCAINNKEKHWINPVEVAYVFDCWECIKVKGA